MTKNFSPEPRSARPAEEPPSTTTLAMLLKPKISLQTTLILSAIAAAVACSAGEGNPDDDNSTDLVDGSSSGGGLNLDGGSGGKGGIPDDIIDAPPTESCADGVRDPDEACDDGNMNDGDGCGANCRYVEPGWVCPDEGEPCRAFAKCGDGAAVFPEQCDDGNLDPSDGCSPTCKFEIGWTCDSTPTAPSTCRQTVCGDGAQEGSETCEEANGQPFDGCSVVCQAEPECTDNGCTSSCGDGLIIGEEQCDDGNGTSGDGCSDTCQQEPGYICDQAPPCEGDDCTLQLPIVFRDFNESHPDFWPPYKEGDEDGFAPGIVMNRLDANGKPVYASSPALSHVTSAQTFSEWYTSTDALIVGDIMLYANGEGGYVNRYGANGEQYFAAVKTPQETGNYASQAACEDGCVNRARDPQYPFNGQVALRCEEQGTTCQTERLAIDQERNDLMQLVNQLANAENQNPPNEDLIADLEEQIAAQEEFIEETEAAFDTCLTECQEAFDERIATCEAMCFPCSNNNAQWCVGGEQLALDGNPLFFPIDDAPGILPDTRGAAKIPAQVYMGLGWPWEAGGTGENPPAGSPMHNFHFTSEIAYWFKYTTGMTATFRFIGDDDVFVFVNRRLLIDLGGIHVPLTGEFNFAANGNVTWSTSQPPDPGDEGPPGGPLANGATTVADLGLQDGGVYEIKVFHAERKPEGSSFQLTLSGFNTARSECLPICGDGIIAAGEQCDDGEELNTGGHNRCNADCTIGEYCGDGIVQEEEECDDADPNKPQGCAGCFITVVK